MKPTFFSNPRLGVNIDHVATLRQARGERYPSPEVAAEIALRAGAEQITIHLREDRRHIQDGDLPLVKSITQKYKALLNLEMAASLDMFPMALETEPEWICIVPEKREERTTEGGLNLLDTKTFEMVKRICHDWKSKFSIGHQISLFLEADEKILKRALDLPIDAVEIHTGEYAKKFLLKQPIEGFLKAYQTAQDLVFHHGKKNIHAGHGLTIDSVAPLVELGLFSEYNIGHWIISQAVFDGLETVVRKLNKVIKTKAQP
ncbi:MAG: pyridoxine 5'-phosphate synthase [Bacteriovoracaceae bacterium]|nr:pyridoxine 5'-phosphate synthase [Bacteriovoracaceae bacterium]